MVALFAQLSLITTIAIGLLLLVYWTLKQNPRWLNWLQQSQGLTPNNLALTNVELSIESRLNLDARKCLMIIRAGEERYLVGSTVDRIDAITRMDNYQPTLAGAEAEPVASTTSPPIAHTVVSTTGNASSPIGLTGLRSTDSPRFSSLPTVQSNVLTMPTLLEKQAPFKTMLQSLSQQQYPS